MRATTRPRVLPLLLAGVLVALGLSAGRADAAYPGENGKIAFVRGFDAIPTEIFVMDPDGTNLTRLTTNSLPEAQPAWSPDGARIAFTRGYWATSDAEIYVMDSDGTDVTRVTENAFSDSSPSWSPDGQRIAFASHRDGDFEIYVMSADGSGETKLTDNTVPDYEPAWSPDGTRIAFSRSLGHLDSDVHVMNADGSGERNVSNDPIAAFSPAWSPDGTRLVFTSLREAFEPGCQGYEEDNSRIYSMNADGSEQRRLTEGSCKRDHAPAWSPDGTRITFTGRSVGPNASFIHVMNTDGTGLTPLTAWEPGLESGDSQSDWQPVVAPANTGPPIISGGDFEVGEQAVATRGTWSGTPPLALEFQWQRCRTTGPRRCTDIARAISDTYEITAADACTHLQVVVTATNAAGSATATSTQTPRVRAARTCSQD